MYPHYPVDHNDTFDDMYCPEPSILLNIQNIMLKYHDLIKVVLKFKEAL